MNFLKNKNLIIELWGNLFKKMNKIPLNSEYSNIERMLLNHAIFIIFSCVFESR